jgi:hypothetical protein
MNWTVDYGTGPRPCNIPHAWRQDSPVSWEGPAVYRTKVDVPTKATWLRFDGVSYQAQVLVNRQEILVHKGIWDAFDLDLTPWLGSTITLEVRVTKNGGETFPVREVLSGFLPYVFHAFGGIYGDVRLVDKPLAMGPTPSPALEVSETRLRRNGQPFYVRGLLHWGWYPELGHTNPPADEIRKEVRKAKDLGFNLVKFCLWVPPHCYLEILEEEDMLAWLELPLWDPVGDSEALTGMADELVAIVGQYRHHRSIAIWTIGCELGGSTPPEWRKELVDKVLELTGCPLVKDNSGGAEMYGGSPSEYGTFRDYHPYCDTQFYGPVLESLCNGPREKLPILLGEFNDTDVVRDFDRLRQDSPFWLSLDPDLNEQGVRWQHDFPRLLASAISSDAKLSESSRRKAIFIRRHVHELVRQQEDIAGYVVTGWRDTPISTSGFFDDWGDARFTKEECQGWNDDACFFRTPLRRPPWVNGGNRPGWRSLANFYEDEEVHLSIGTSAPLANGEQRWQVSNSTGEVLQGSCCSADGKMDDGNELPGVWKEIGGTFPVGSYTVEVQAMSVKTSWPFHVFPRFKGWEDAFCAHEADGVVILDRAGTLPRPFWREAAYRFHPGCPFAEQWEVWLDICPDCVLDPAALTGRWPEAEVVPLLTRVDTRTYEELPVLVRLKGATDGTEFVTTVRPWGGLGSQPYGVRHNPAGGEFLRLLLQD